MARKKKNGLPLILAIAIIFILVIAFILMIPGKGKAAAKSDNITVNNVEVAEYSAKTDKYNIVAYYPTTSSADVNEYIAKKIETEAEAFAAASKKKGFFNKNEYFASFEMTEYADRPNIVSIKWDIDSTHKRSMKSDIDTLTINLNTGRVYEYENLFKEEGYEDLLPELDDYSDFIVNGDELVFLNKKGKEYPVKLELFEDYIIGDLGGGLSDEELNEMQLIALTFDDGPTKNTTPQLLDILEKEDVPATFYVLGSNAKANPDVLKDVYDRGHQIASHTYNHKNLPLISDAERQDEINSTIKVVEDATGEKPSTMRPPYGAFNDTVRAEVGTPLVMWSVDTLDWKSRNAEAINNVTMSTVHDGAIILLHDIHQTTIDAVPTLIQNLKAAGYHFVTVDDLIRVRGERVDGEVYNSLPPAA